MKTYNDLKNEMSKARFKKKPFYIFTGEERRLKQIYLKRLGDNVKPIKNASELMRELTSMSLFATNRVFVLDNDKTVSELEFDRFFKSIKADTVVLMCDSMDSRKKFFKDAEEYIYEFKKQPPEVVAKFVKTLVDVSDDLALLIADRCSCDITKVELEVDKLKMIEEPITIELIDKLITPAPEDFVFEMVKAIAMKKALITYAIYEDLKALKESPIKIISLLYTQFKQMIQVQGYGNMANRDICAKTGLMFWQVDKAKEVLGQFSTPELVEILLKIQQCEVDMKTGNIETELAFEKLLLEVVG